MSSEEVKRLTELYFDNELEKSREAVLFTMLSGDEEAREYFKQLNLIHSAVKENEENFPSALEERILDSIEIRAAKPERLFKRNFYVNAASLITAALLLIVSAFLFLEMKEYKSRVELVSEQFAAQKQTIDLIINNSLPPVEIRSRKLNEVIVNANL